MTADRTLMEKQLWDGADWATVAGMYIAGSAVERAERQAMSPITPKPMGSSLPAPAASRVKGEIENDLGDLGRKLSDERGARPRRETRPPIPRSSAASRQVPEHAPTWRAGPAFHDGG